MPARRLSLDWPELILVAASLVAGTWLVTHTRAERALTGHYFVKGPMSELEPIRAKYGPDHNSANVEEWLIRDFFQDQRDGVFVDVGASYHQAFSNTYYLERHLGWSGLAIDALAELEEGYRQHRPRTKFVAMFASDVPNRSVQFFVPTELTTVASTNQTFTAGFGDPGRARQVPTTTLNIALTQAGITAIDFLSMDIELSEPAALKGFDIDQYRPKLVCIEAHPELRQFILDYFDEHRYRLIGKYLRIDMANLYFTPRAE